MPQKCVSGRGSTPDTAGGACSAPPNPVAGFEGATLPAYAYKSEVCFNLVLLIKYILHMVLESP